MWTPPERIKHALPEVRWPSAEEAARSRLFSPVKLGPLEARSAPGCRRWCRGAPPRTASSRPTCSIGMAASPTAGPASSSSRPPASATSRRGRSCASATIASCPASRDARARRSSAARSGETLAVHPDHRLSCASAAAPSARSSSPLSPPRRDAPRGAGAHPRRRALAARARRRGARGARGARRSGAEPGARRARARVARARLSRAVTDVHLPHIAELPRGAAAAVRRRRRRARSPPASTASSCTTRTRTRWRRSSRR